MRNRKIAVIDEDKKFLAEIEGILSMGGYAPILIDNVFWAVDMVIDKEPDVILMELKMPHKNGFELTDAINRVFESRKIPVIAMSELFKHEYSWLLDFIGIKRWIKKPFQPLDVIWAIENEIEDDLQWGKERCLSL